MRNKVVARFADGRMVKGSTSDFVPTKDVFHVADANAGAASPPTRIQVADLKALEVVFKNGETLVGTTQGYQPGRPGFFMVPADTNANTERCYVVTAATKSVTLL